MKKNTDVTKSFFFVLKILKMPKTDYKMVSFKTETTNYQEFHVYNLVDKKNRVKKKFFLFLNKKN